MAMRRKPTSVPGLDDLGRVRLSRHFFLRDFLHSEIADLNGIPNVPDDPDLAIAAGRALCETLLEPLCETFGPITIRSGLRTVAVNDLGNARGWSCARSESDFAGHIWDRRDAAGRMGATATVVIPWFVDRYEAGRDWRDLGWWLWDHLEFHEVWFFPKLAAFNLTWKEGPAAKRLLSYIAPKRYLVRESADPGEVEIQRRARYADFPRFRGLDLP